MTDAALAQLIIDNALAYAIFTLDFEGRITSWSPGAERVVGYPADEAVGMNFTEIFMSSDRSAGIDRLELQRAIEDGRAEDTRWHRRKDGERFWANGVTTRIEGADELLKVMRDETRGKLAEDQRVMLLNELNHRIKNTLATVQSIVEHTLRGAGVDAIVRQNLTERLIALSEAHNLLVRDNWASSELEAIVQSVVQPHRTSPPRFQLDGPPVRLNPNQAVSMSLVLHELTTNALKYGALSAEGGQVRLTWNLAYGDDGGRSMTLLWEETGGPPVSSPTRRGFGTRLIARSFSRSGGRAAIEYRPEGLRCIVDLPLSMPEELPQMNITTDPARLDLPK
jgi:PAS domain S-box-containing protein